MAIINQQNFQIKSGNAWYKLCPFPVGFVYLGYTSTSPASTFGGSWSAMATGRYVRLSNNVTASGSNTISEEQMPSHSHSLQDGSQGHYAGWYGSGAGGDKLLYGQVANGRHIFEFYNQYTARQGGGEEFTPKYQNLYAWRRTA